MHSPNGRADQRDARAPHPAPEPAPRRETDRDLADRAYRALLARCPLSDAHRAALHARGLTDDQLGRHGYGTLPDDATERARIARAIADDLGVTLAGQVPGFILRRSRADLASVAGLLIPYRAGDGHIAGLQVRRDAVDDGPRYLWFSAGDGPASIGQDGHTIHVARPARPTSTRCAVITEGALKANITADKLGCIVLAIAGVGNTGHVVDTLAELGDVVDIAMAFDADRDTNPAVAHHDATVARLIANAGYRVAQWQWSRDAGKGIDDLLRAGLLPFPIPHPALITANTADATPSELIGHRLEHLTHERDSVRWLNAARARIQRNGRLPARGMAVAVISAFNGAIDTERPAGNYQGQVPAGFVLAPVGALSFDAGTRAGNGGKQLKALDTDVQGISRLTKRDVRHPGEVDLETGEILTKPRAISYHFIAIRGHEDEPLTRDTVQALAERFASYDPAKPERRGGRRIPRCKTHPNAPVERDWVARCSVCHEALATGTDIVPPMLLEPRFCDAQSLLLTARDEREDDFPLGTRPNAKQHASSQDAAFACDTQSLLLTEGSDDFGLVAPVLSDPQDILQHVDRAAPSAARPALNALFGELADIATARGRTPIPKPQAAPLLDSAEQSVDPWDAPYIEPAGEAGLDQWTQ